MLRHIQLRLAEIAVALEEVQFENSVMTKEYQTTVKMTGVNQDIKLKLEQDLGQVQIEKTSIETYTNEKKQKLQTMRSEMIRLHRENMALEKKLKQYHLEIERQIEKEVNSLTMSE